MDKIGKVVEYLRRLSSFYSKITQSMFNKEILFEKDSHSLFAAFVATLNRRFVDRGYIKDYLELSKILIESSERFSSHRFTSKQLNGIEKLEKDNLQPNKFLE